MVNNESNNIDGTKDYKNNDDMGSVNSLLPRAYGYNFTILQEDYVTIFEISAAKHQDQQQRETRMSHAVAKAYISYSLEVLTNNLYRDTHSEDNLWCYLSFPEMERRLHGAYKMRTLKDAMKEMIEDGYVFKRPNSKPQYNTLEYRMNLAKYRSEIQSLPTKSSKVSSAKMHDETTSAKMHDEELPVSSAKMHGDSCKNALTHSAKMHAIIKSNIITDIISKDTYSDDAAIADHHATLTPSKQIIHPLYDFIALDDPITPKQLIVYLTSVGQYSSESEDKIRAFIAEEVKVELERRGHTISYCWLHEPEPTFAPAVVESSAHENNSHSQQGGANPHPSSDNMTPPTIEVANGDTPRRSGEVAQTHIQYGRQVGKNGITSVTFQEMLDAQQKQSHHDATQDSASLPPELNENTATPSNPSNDTRVPEIASVRENEASVPGDNKQASYSQDIQADVQPPLAAEKPAIPAMPPAELKWSAEKLVQITECKRIARGKVGVYFDEDVRGNSAKSQRQRQLEAAKRILDKGVTEEEYIKAYDERNDDWWNQTQGSLTVEEMAANTKNRVMRILEILEKLDSISKAIGLRQTVQGQKWNTSQQQQRAERAAEENAHSAAMNGGLTYSEINRLKPAEKKAYLEKLKTKNLAAAQ